jgi:hypothetical protein
MTVRKSAIFVLFTLICCISAAAGQKEVFKVIEFPLTLAQTPSDILHVGWVGGSGLNPLEPDSADIYFDRSPGGGKLSNYRYKVNALKGINDLTGGEYDNNKIVGGDAVFPTQRRRTAFQPAGQGDNMGPGVYYCIVARVKDNDTLYSNEFIVMVDAPNAPKPKGPKGNNITDLTPTFEWERVANVPYYHIILSDEPLPIDLSDIENPTISGDLSIVWQAITPKTSITYGEPDPVGIITASPPPLSPGKEYSWIVFSNFGNHPAFSSAKLSLPEPFLKFKIAGEPLNKPVNVLPADKAVFDIENDPVIDFKWTNLDTNAGSYLVNLFVTAEPSNLGLGSEVDELDIKGSILVWETTVLRGNKKQGDTLTARLDAKNTLTGGSYKWRVFALDQRGAGTAGDASDFYYRAPTGWLEIKTIEDIGGGIENRISVVELNLEVLSGPMEKPLAFYTSTDGYILRERPVGTYRITAVKEGYKTETRTVSVRDGETTPLDIYMERPKAVIYGKITDADDIPLNLANVTAISEWGDTARALTNGSGHFSLNCSDADWTVYIDMAGYRSSSPVKVPLKPGDNYKLPDVKLERSPIVLSGSVKNGGGVPVIGARVRVFREGTLINELPSTPQTGNFSFSLAAGVYTLTAEKAGFATYSAEIAVSGSRTQNITLRAGAALINGMVIGSSWSNEINGYINAPVPSARVKFWEEGSADTVAVTSDAVFGNFSVGLEGGKSFKFASSAAGFTAKGVREISPLSSETQNITDTLYALAMISGLTKNEAGSILSGVDVVVFDTENNRVAAAGRSSGDGSFEVRNIYDGKFTLNAGLAGYYSEGGAVDFEVIDGKPQGLGGAVLPAFEFVLKGGETDITWNIKSGDGSAYNGKGYVKIASPYMRAIPFDGTLEKAGEGDYIIEAQADDTTLLNLSYHKFTNEGGAARSVEFSLPFTHKGKDTLKVGDTLKIIGGNISSIKSAALFYRSEGSAEFRSEEGRRSGDSYSFNFPYARDGSVLYYYFNVYTSDGSIYGSQKQIYRSYVKPEPSIISRFEIIPGVSGGDTLLLPSSYGAQFSFRAFYSSSFIPIEDMSSFASSISWSLEGEGAADCKLEGGGLNVTVRTGSKESAGVTLTASLNLPADGVFSLASDLAGSYRVPFKVSGGALESITVLRIDPKAPDAITNTEEAAFRAVGINKKKKTVTVSPQWTILPAEAGRINSDGKFTPRTKYVGNVRVFAAAGGMNGEFNPVNKDSKVTIPGFVVSYMLKNSSSADTISNFKGLKIACPAGSIDAGEVEQFEVSTSDMKNKIKKNSGKFIVADSVAFDIVPRGGNARLNFRGSKGDSITVVLDIPSDLREEARKNKNFYVAWWNPGKLEWQTVNKYEDAINSVISPDGATVSAAVSHFSEYAVVMRPQGFDASLTVSPNPFSPFIRPVREHGPEAPAGTRIRVGITAPGRYVASVKVHVYNAVGHRVWAVEKLNPQVGENYIWWDGRTSKREEVWTENFNEKNKNSAMARNGRYFVTVIVKNTDGEIKRLMKPVVLMK